MVRLTMVLALVVGLSGCSNSSSVLKGIEQVAGQVLSDSGGGLSTSDIAGGLRQALSVGSQNVVGQLGRVDGFNSDPVAHIPLPRGLEKVRDVARKVGLSGELDDLETRINRAAEQATPKAKALFLSAISRMSIDDAVGILRGPDDAATQYFRGTMGGDLANAMRPIIDDSLSQVGAVQSFNSLLASYKKIPLAPPIEADLTDHVLEKGVNGIFHYIAVEEKAIREDPLKRTTELMQRVFGASQGS